MSAIPTVRQTVITVHAVSAPVTVNPMWMQSVTPEMVLKAKEERMAKVMRGDLEEAATDWEALVYLSTQSLAAPFSETWNHIMFHLFGRFYPKAVEEGVVDKIELDDYEKAHLQRLKQWIYHVQKKELKKRKPDLAPVVEAARHG